MYGLNKPYLSWSALSLWQQSQARYRKQYYEKSPRFNNIYTRFGKKIHDRLEKDPTFLPDIDRVGLREQSIEGVLEGVHLKGFVDYIDLRIPLIRDYKTSKKQWTVADVAKNKQLVFYSVLVEQEFGIPVDEVDILWLETKEKAKEEKIGGVAINTTPELNLSGHYEIIKRPEPVSALEKEEMKEWIITNAQAILEDYKSYLAS